MMYFAPCKKCEKKGCGAYHDKCPDFIEYRKKVTAQRIKEMNISEKDYRRQRYKTEGVWPHDTERKNH